jgi:hypothetical protein
MFFLKIIKSTLLLEKVPLRNRKSVVFNFLQRLFKTFRSTKTVPIDMANIDLSALNPLFPIVEIYYRFGRKQENRIVVLIT